MVTQSPHDESGKPTPSNAAGGAASLLAYWPLILALWIAEIMGSFENSMIYAAISDLNADLADPVKLGWLVTIYLLVASGAAAVAGRLGDLFGRQRVMVLLLLVGVVGSLMSAFSPNYTILLIGRGLQGLCGAVLPLTVGLARENLPKERLSVGIGIMLSGTSVGTAAGLIIGGMLADKFSWHSIFIASALLGAVSFITVLAAVPRSPRLASARQVDWVGGLLFVPGIMLLLAVISYAPKWGLLAPATLGLGAGSIAILGLWLRTSLKAENPLLDVRLFRQPTVLLINLIIAVLSLGALQVTLVAATLLQAPAWTLVGLGATATISGLVKFPSNIVGLFAAPLGGRLITRHGARFTLAMAGAVSGAGWLILAVLHGSALTVGIILCVITFGTAMVFSASPIVLALTVPHDRTSEATGMMTVTRQAFMGIGAQLITLLMASSTVSLPGGRVHYPTGHAMMLTIGVISALSFGVTLLALGLPRRLPYELATKQEPPEPASLMMPSANSQTKA